MLGIDINQLSVKVVELSYINQELIMIGQALEYLPAKTVLEDNIVKAKASEAVAALQRAIAKGGFKSKEAAVCVTGSMVINKTIQVESNLSDDELVIAVEESASKFLPFPRAEVNLDFKILGPAANSPNLVNVLLVAARKELINSKLELIQNSGLSPKIIDIRIFAMERALNLFARFMPQMGLQKSIMLVELDASNTYIMVIRNSQLIYYKEENIGILKIIDEICLRYGLEQQQACKLFSNNLFPRDCYLELVAPFKSNFMKQIKVSLQFYLSTHSTEQVDAVVLTGEVQHLHNISKLEEMLNIPCFLAQPLLNNANAISPSMAGAIGLATREANDVIS